MKGFGGFLCTAVRVDQIRNRRVAIGENARAQHRMLNPDFAESCRTPENSGQLEIRQEVVDRIETGAVAIQKIKGFDCSDQRERIEANLADPRLAMELRLGQTLDFAADYPRNYEKPKRCVYQNCERGPRRRSLQ